MRSIKRLSQLGLTVLATIHQPSQEIFDYFDRILFLNSTGQMIYQGHNRIPLRQYFQPIYQRYQAVIAMESRDNDTDTDNDAHSTVSKSSFVLGSPMESTDLCDWILQFIVEAQQKAKDIINNTASAASSASIAELNCVEYFRSSPQYEMLHSILDQAIRECIHIPNSGKSTTAASAVGYSASSIPVETDICTRFLTFLRHLRHTCTLEWRRFIQLFLRFHVVYQRFLVFVLTRYTIFLSLGILFGWIYSATTLKTESGLFSVYCIAVTSVGFLGIIFGGSYLTIGFTIRSIYYREYHRMYPLYARETYITTAGLLETLYCIPNILLFLIPFYFMLPFQFTFTAFIQSFIVYLLVALNLNIFDQLLVATTPNLFVANILNGIIITMFFLFSGIFVTPNSIPKGFAFLYYLSPISKGGLAISAVQFACSSLNTAPLQCPLVQSNLNGPIPIALYMKQLLNVDAVDSYLYWSNIGYLIIQLVIMRMILSIAYKYCRFISR